MNAYRSRCWPEPKSEFLIKCRKCGREVERFWLSYKPTLCRECEGRFNLFILWIFIGTLITFGWIALEVLMKAWR